jgi:MEMO1 family protein
VSSRSDPAAVVREPAVAGAFYPGRPEALQGLVSALVDGLPPVAGPLDPLGGLVPHAGLVYSGAVAAAGWRALLAGTGPEPTVVILGTNHSAWFEGVAVFDAGVWRTPLADVRVDGEVAASLLALGVPFGVSRAAHRDEHSIEVQLPLLAALRPRARIVPCSVAAGTGPEAVEAGRRLGELLAALRSGGGDIRLAISTDMAHYPSHQVASGVTERLVPSITALDAEGTAARERAESESGMRGIACGMCGIQPTVLGLAALRAAGASAGAVVATATSADAGGPSDRTVGYLAVVFG